MTISRRVFLGASAASVGAAAELTLGREQSVEEPPSPNFFTLPLKGNTSLTEIEGLPVSEVLKKSASRAPTGSNVFWGIPFDIGRVLLLANGQELTERISPIRTEWLVFLHTTDVEPLEWNEDGFVSPTRGEGRLREKVAEYTVSYGDGTQETLQVLRRHQIGMLQRMWGENCFEAVAQHHPYPVPAFYRQASGRAGTSWGLAEQLVTVADQGVWTNWLCPWLNPHPDKEVTGIGFRSFAGTIVVSAVSAGVASSFPCRWEPRRKVLLEIPQGVTFDYDLEDRGLLKQIRLDMGQIISAQPRMIYPNDAWSSTYNNQAPRRSTTQVHIEYAAHPDARFHFEGGLSVPVSDLQKANSSWNVRPVNPARQRVKIRVLDRQSGRPVPVKLHMHGESDEYLPPVDHHRIPNPAWFEDYGAEFVNQLSHNCAYIPGETIADLPLGNVYIEVSKGFEIEPVRKVVRIDAGMEKLDLEVEKVLPWREKNWVSADTHVHFLSPQTALLEGKAEGVNIVNLLASQWGELMTNVGDFDGETTFGSREAGGDGEWLVRVGSENRQHVMGHISLLGYGGDLISPMCAGGPAASALGDPVDVLLMEWAQQCRAQGGLVVIPHFPEPRTENAAALVNGDVDAIEVTSLASLYRGINPYSLSDYYRYLNCGYFVPIVGGTDKMNASIAVGALRTYTRIPDEQEFTYAAWMDAVRAGRTFVTYGPLLEFSVDGQLPGSRLEMRPGGGTVDVTWELASVTVPMSRLELIVNGEIRESLEVDPHKASGHWSVHLDRSSWLALLVRGHYYDKPEMIAAHSSPVMVTVSGSDFHSAADAVTILEQIEGTLAFLDTVGTRAEDAVYKRMRLKLTSVHRKLHNEMHRRGVFHQHTEGQDHGH